MNYLEYLLQEAQELAESFNFDIAYEKYSKIIEAYPKNWEAFNGRADCKIDFEDYKGAIEDYFTALKLSPDNPKVHYNIGCFYLNEYEYKKGIDFISKAILLSPDAKSYLVRGNTYTELKCYHKALSDYLKALEMDQEDIITYIYIIESLYALNDYKSLKKYIQAIENKFPESDYPPRMKEFIEAPEAKKSDWINKPFSSKVYFDEKTSVTTSQYKMLKKGLIPKDDKDKWFVYFEDETLFCHRSNDGQRIYEIQFEEEGLEYVSTKIIIEGNKNIYQINEDAESSFIDLLLNIGLGCSFSDEFTMKFMVRKLLKKVTFDELEDKFGRIIFLNNHSYF